MEIKISNIIKIADVKFHGSSGSVALWHAVAVAAKSSVKTQLPLRVDFSQTVCVNVSGRAMDAGFICGSLG